MIFIIALLLTFFISNFIVLHSICKKRALSIRPNVAIISAILSVISIAVFYITFNPYVLVIIMAIVRFILFLFIKENGDNVTIFSYNRDKFIGILFTAIFFTPLLAWFLFMVWWCIAWYVFGPLY